MRNTTYTLSVLVVAALLAACASVTAAPTVALTPTPKPDIALVVLTSPVAAEGKVAIMIQTTPGETCSIYYHPPGGSAIHAAGLEDKVADARGLCSWTWSLHRMGRKQEAPEPGTGRIFVVVDGTWKEFDITLK